MHQEQAQRWVTEAAELWLSSLCSNGQPVPPALRETGGYGRLGHSFTLGAFLDNSINDNIKQKPLKGRISKLAQYRAQPAAGSFPGTRPQHTDGGGGEHNPEDCCKDSGLEMLVLTLSG